MWKYLFLLVILLDWGTGIYSGTTPTSSESKFKIEAQEVEIFELDYNGENVVDSVVNYTVGGAIHHQWIYYKDGSRAFFQSDFNIKDLKLRCNYIRFKNKFKDTVYNYTLLGKTTKEIQKNFPSNYNQELVEEYLSFNGYLSDIKEPIIESYTMFLNEVKGAKTPLISSINNSENKSKVLVELSLFICVILTAIAYKKSVYKCNSNENTS